MIVTPDFVFINNPRTGTTFVRKAITAAYLAIGESERKSVLPVRELFLPIRRGVGHTGIDHHGTVAQIPRKFRSLPIVSAVRNPFTLLVAIYELGLWEPKSLTLDPTGELDRHEPGSFPSFVRAQELAMERRWGIAFGLRPGFGPLSLHHLQMFSAQPQAAFRRVASGASDAEVEELLAPVAFLRQERLQDDLSAYLQERGALVSLNAVRDHPASHVTKRKQVWSHDTFSEEMVSHILSREAFLFRALSRRGFQYTFESADFGQRARREATAADGGGNSTSRMTADNVP
jgi:hypothetical protein